MFKTLDPTKLAYLDIETVPLVRNFKDLPDRLQSLWIKRADKDKVEFRDRTTGDITNPDVLNQHWQENAALIPEFGRIVSIVIGVFDDGIFKTRVYDGEDEALLIERFFNVLDHAKVCTKRIIAHNGKGFDYPYIIKRSLILGINPHKAFHFYDKKPWEVTILDSKEIWKFNSFGMPSTSLDLLTAVFGLPSPKAFIQGADVWKHFYNEDGSCNEDGLANISRYCENDVISLCQAVCYMTMWHKKSGFIVPQLKEFN